MTHKEQDALEKLNVDDKVLVINENSDHYCEVGTVFLVDEKPDSLLCWVGFARSGSFDLFDRKELHYLTLPQSIDAKYLAEVIKEMENTK